MWERRAASPSARRAWRLDFGADSLLVGIEVANKTASQSTLTRAKNTWYNCHSMIKAVSSEDSKL